MTYILMCQFLGGKYSKWIVILQDFDLEFTISNSKKSMSFSELIYDIPTMDDPTPLDESIPDETLFLIIMLDPWYGYIHLYLQTQNFRPELSHSERRRTRYQS